MGKPMITVRNVSFAYGKDNVLTDVNFIVEEQEYVGIIGANGAGKSTLMKLILGQLTPSGGGGGLRRLCAAGGLFCCQQFSG